MPKLERTGLPFAPIGKPEEMFDDPHLLANGKPRRDDAAGRAQDALAQFADRNGRASPERWWNTQPRSVSTPTRSSARSG
jgi:crotonobetainyl-CoA:carnitine CoA-transferase CaiB-like acyl-CoA transferase